MTFRKLQFYLGGFVSLLAFALYVVTLCPTVDFIDAGELATVATTLGIAHPTGYPLFTLIGWIFAHLPLGFRTIYKLNLMPAVECSAALFFFFCFLVFFLTEFSLKRNPGSVGKPGNEKVTERSFLRVFVPALCGTLALAFCETYWSQANSIEVYSLHTLFLSLLLLVFTKAIACDVRDDGADKTEERRLHRSLWMGFAYVLGLAFSNHMTTILLAPAFLYLYFYVNGFSLGSWRKLLHLAVPFILGLSLYLYLPVRAGQKPIMNWGNPIDLDRFFWHFSGKQYHVWLFASSDAAMKQFAYYMDTVLPVFGYVPLLIALAGVWELFRRSKSVLVFTVLLFLGCLLYSINYDIHDIDSYFLLTYYTIAMWIAAGALAVVQYISRRAVLRGVAAVLVAACLIPLFSNYEKVDGSKNFVVEDYAKNVIASLEPNAIVISYQWDYFVSAAYYFQLIEKVRPDVIIIDKELMRRSWYYLQLETRYPWLVQQSRKEIDEFLRELYKFEHDLPYNSQLIEYRYAMLIKSFIDRNIGTRPVYVTHEIEPQYLADYHRVPSGLAFRLESDSLFHDIAMPELKFRAPARMDILTQQVLRIYAQAYVNEAIYLNYFGKNGESIGFLNKALEILPDYEEALALKSQISRGKEVFGHPQ